MEKEEENEITNFYKERVVTNSSSFHLHTTLIMMEVDRDEIDQGSCIESSEAENRSELPSQKEAKSDFEDCPLFMTGLPSNFAQNRGLAAIASLMSGGADDDVLSENNENESKVCKRQSDTLKEKRRADKKVKGRRALKSASKYSPYKERHTKAKVCKKDTTVQEAQLFLSMWSM